jgi:tripartite-type tricarboxylate transporter receptor subunit TctC
MHMKRRQILALALSCVVMSTTAQPRGYPTKPIRLIAPFAAGGPTDTLARSFALQLGEQLKQQVIVDNRPGAGGNIGIDLVAKAAPDGYTIGLGTNGPLAGNVALFKRVPYDPVKDLAPIARIAYLPNMIAVHPSVPAKNMAELIALLKSQPDAYNFGSGGNGTTSHLGGEYIKMVTGTHMTHVPYKGDGPGLADAVGGQMPIIIASQAVTVPYVQEGRLRAIAVTSRQRNPSLPDVPTVVEAGIAGYDLDPWYGLVAPAGTPADIVQQLGDASLRVMKSERMREKLTSIGGIPAPMPPAEFAAFMKAEIPRWTQIIRRIGAKAD